MLPTVTDIRNELDAAGVQGVPGYCDKLEPNCKTPAVYRDMRVIVIVIGFFIIQYSRKSKRSG